jgi:hypothetical protein
LIGQNQVVVRYERVHELSSNEELFAYARATPDGRFLAYTSQERYSPPFVASARTINVVDLETDSVVFRTSGMDPYWANDGSRMVFLHTTSVPSVSIWQRATGEVFSNVASTQLGDYYSWAVRDGKDVVLTILGNYYYIDSKQIASPPLRVPQCPVIGAANRPLISHDGRRISVFHRGTVLVRNIDDCDDVLETGLPGGKSDFSWDGRYLAMHTPKVQEQGYEITVVDMAQKVSWTATDLPGSSMFPSWLNDGRLLFSYDGPDYRGFIIADGFIKSSGTPLRTGPRSAMKASWKDVFPTASMPVNRIVLAMIWSTWSAHSAEALVSFQQSNLLFNESAMDVGLVISTEPGSDKQRSSAMLSRCAITLPMVPTALNEILVAEAANQMPTTLLFSGGTLADRKLGALTAEELHGWVSTAASGRGFFSGRAPRPIGRTPIGRIHRC